MQKTWTDILGPWGPDCVTEDRYIVRAVGARRQVLMSFDTPAQAALCYRHWQHEASAGATATREVNRECY